MKKFSLFLLCLVVTSMSLAQTPERINYQAVVRDATGASVANQLVGIKITIHSGAAAGPEVYSETHGATTNSYGLVNLQIGAGTVSGPALSTLNWGATSYFVKIQIDPTGGTAYSITSSSQLVSVPYALYAKNVENVDDADADPTNEYITGASMNGNNLEITDGGGTIIVDMTALTTDADMNPTNEIQTLTKVGSIVSLSGGGGAFTDDVNDADASPTNELNATMTLVGTTLQLTDAGGTLSTNLASLGGGADPSSTNELNTSVTLSGTNLQVTDAGGTITTSLASLVNDADANPSNELQTIAKVGQTVTLSNSGGSFTDDVNDADADPSNELQTISKVGNLVTLSNSGGSFTVDDADASATNEFNTSVTLTGSNLNVTDGGGTIVVDLSSLGGGVDPSSTNELNTNVTLVGTTLSVIDAGGSVSVDLSSLQDGVTDGDADPNNELITGAVLSGTNLEITDAGGTTTVDLSSLSGGGGTDYKIGQKAFGGVIIFVDSTGQAGLVAGLTDIETAIVFDPIAGAPGGVILATSFYDGAANTAALDAGLGVGSCAARSCVAYTGGGYTDWYLPSAFELELIFNSNYILGPNALLSGISTGSPKYWSSTQDNAAFGYSAFRSRNYPYTIESASENGNAHRVRPVRAFP